MQAELYRSLVGVLVMGGALWGCDAIFGISAGSRRARRAGAAAPARPACRPGWAGTGAPAARPAGPGPPVGEPLQVGAPRRRRRASTPRACAPAQCAYALTMSGTLCNGSCDGKGNCVPPPADRGADAGPTCAAPCDTPRPTATCRPASATARSARTRRWRRALHAPGGRVTAREGTTCGERATRRPCRVAPGQCGGDVHVSAPRRREPRAPGACATGAGAAP